jgi:hemolysin activation/secretion protein
MSRVANGRLRLARAVALLLLLPAGAAAQLPPPLPGIIERVSPQEVPRLAPSPAPAAPEVRRGPGEDRVVRIGRVELTDATVLTAAALAPTFAGLEGQVVSLRRIEEARVAVLSAFRAAGYPFVAANALLVPVGDGSFDLRLAVVEAEIVEIRLDGDIGPAATQALRFAEPLSRMGPLQGAALERALLLISDIPGVSVQGVLQPIADRPGALRLVLQLDRQPFSGLVTADNRGFRRTGPIQSLAVLQANSFTEFGERTEVSLYGTEALSQRFGQVSAEWFVGGSGLRVRAYAGQGETEPRGVLAAIGYQGQSTVAGAGVSYPLIRSRPANLTLLGQYDVFDGSVDAANGAVAARDEVHALRFGVQGQLLDPWEIGSLPPGITFGIARLHQGIGGSLERSTRAGSADDFTKLTGEVQRNQPLAAFGEEIGLGLQLLLSGQASSSVLPVSEKFLLGGARITRGYFAGQVSGDSGWAAGAELQLETGVDLPGAMAFGVQRLQVQGYVFYDYGRAWQNTTLERDISLASFGGGVRLFFDRHVQLEAELVRRLERRPDGAGTSREDPVGAFLSLVARY